MEKDKTIRLINTLLKNIDHIYDEELISMREQIIKTLKSQVKILEEDYINVYKGMKELQQMYLDVRRKLNKYESEIEIPSSINELTGNKFGGGYED